MKPNFRIYNILRPLGWIYSAVTAMRNRRFDRHPELSARFDIPVISVGNITAGGTGKTPHTEYIVSLLKDRYRVSVLSRGYGRHTHGYLLASPASTSRQIGDEPRQILTHFPDVDVAVSEDRAKGISMLLDTRRPQAVILDDAFQHRRITPSLNILLVNFNRNILADAMLPAGRLRESIAGRRRADIIIVTKCPAGISQSQMDEMASLLAVRPGQQVYFTALQYGSLYALDGIGHIRSKDTAVLAVSGIADPAPMEAHLQGCFNLVKTMHYPDHHDFTEQDIKKMEQRLDSMPAGSVIVTTAKDAARFSAIGMSSQLRQRIFILPVQPAFLRDSERFDRTIVNHIETFPKP